MFMIRAHLKYQFALQENYELCFFVFSLGPGEYFGPEEEDDFLPIDKEELVKEDINDVLNDYIEEAREEEELGETS